MLDSMNRVKKSKPVDKPSEHIHGPTKLIHRPSPQLAGDLLDRCIGGRGGQGQAALG